MIQHNLTAVRDHFARWVILVNILVSHLYILVRFPFVFFFKSLHFCVIHIERIHTN